MKPIVRSLVSIYVFFLIAVTLENSHSFTPVYQPSRIDYHIGETVHAVATGHFNRDVWPDLAVLGEGNLFILLNEGNGTFSRPVQQEVSIKLTVGIDKGDLNNDGVSDLIVVIPRTVLVLLGNGDGTFRELEPVSYASDTGAENPFVECNDFNLDGKVDAAVTGPGALLIFEGDGNGTLTLLEQHDHDLMERRLDSGDLNNDGAPDIVAANCRFESSEYEGEEIIVYYNRGNGTFRNPVLFDTIIGPWGVQIVDMNHDGWNDIIGTSRDGEVYLGVVWYLRNLKDETFTFEIGFEEFADSDVVAVNLNTDPYPELVSMGEGYPDDYVQLISNSNGVEFERQEYLGISQDCREGCIVSADFNRDGFDDVAVGSDPLPVIFSGSDGHLQIGARYSSESPNKTAYNVIPNFFNNDDFADILINGHDHYTHTDFFAVFLSNGNGILQDPIFTELSSSIDIQKTCSADFNDDNFADIAFSDRGTFNSVHVHLGDGQGAFLQKFVYTFNNYPWGVAADDLDNDGYIDIAVTCSPKVYVFFNDGTGAFPVFTEKTIFDRSLGEIICQDIENDGDTDLVIGAYDRGIIVVPNLGNRVFGTLNTYSIPFNVGLVTAGFLDSDDFIDLIVSYENSWCCLQNDESGGFILRNSFTNKRNCDGVGCTDVDGDGQQDVLISNVDDNSIYVFYNQEDFQFSQQHYDYGFGMSARSFGLIDLNSDGSDDLAVKSLHLLLSFKHPETGFKTSMPGDSFHPGDEVWLKGRVTNLMGSTMYGTNLFVVLDIGTGDYWFWPDWVPYPPDIDYLPENVEPGFKEFYIIEPFVWPDDTGEVHATFWSAILSYSLETVIGDLHSVSFIGY